VDFCIGVCKNLSTDVFSEVALKNLVKISNFSTEDQKRSQPASNHCPPDPPPHLPSNFTAATMLTDDCSIRTSQILEGAKPPHNLFEVDILPVMITKISPLGKGFAPRTLG